LVVIAFFGLSWFTTKTMLSPDAAPSDATMPSEVVTPGEVSNWIVVAMMIGVAALLVLGVHPPSQLTHLLHRAAAELASAR
jgi:hydrogenase-4 component F